MIRLRPHRTWFDRLSLYRYVALLLLPLFVSSTVRAITESHPFTWKTAVFWFANLLIWSAVIRDTWEVIKVKREIRRSIREVVNRDDPVS
jgi:hypothetical protein